MVKFIYKHITQNQSLENFAINGFSNLIEDLRNKQSIRSSFYRIFDDKNLLKDVELNAVINGNAYHIIAAKTHFKDSVSYMLKKLEINSLYTQT
jgi:hypothetical protein